MANKSNKTTAPQVDLAPIASTSGKIRACHAVGMKVAEIERYLKSNGVTTKNGDPIRYQHVRNVLNTPIGTKIG